MASPITSGICGSGRMARGFPVCRGGVVTQPVITQQPQKRDDRSWWNKRLLPCKLSGGNLTYQWGPHSRKSIHSDQQCYARAAIRLPPAVIGD